MSARAEEKKFGKATVTFRLKDWGISRQRYWGTPIPMVYCEKDGVRAPSPKVLCPSSCRITFPSPWPADRRSQMCPNLKPRPAQSVAARLAVKPTPWTRLLIPPGTSIVTRMRGIVRRLFDSEKIPYWFPIDQYIGGVEHAILHLIYSRFWTKFMRDMGIGHKRRTRNAIIHPGNGDQRRRQDVKELGKCRFSGRDGARVTVLTRHGCTVCSQRLRIATWIGRNRASRGSRDFSEECTGSICEIRCAFLLRLVKSRRYLPTLAPSNASCTRQSKRVSTDFEGTLALQHLHCRRHGIDERRLWRRGSDCRRAYPRVASRGDTAHHCLVARSHGPLHGPRLWEMTGETSNLLKAPWPKYVAALAAEG